MVNVDIKSLLSRLNDFCTNTLQAGAGLCVSRTHYEVTVEHFILKVIEDPRSDISLIFKQFEIESGTVLKKIETALEELKTGNSSRPVFSPRLLDLFQDAWMVASIELEENDIRSGAVLRALLERPQSYVSGSYDSQLKEISLETLKEQFFAITKGSNEASSIKPASASKPGAGEPRKSGSFIDRFCNNFTEKASQGDIDPVFGRDEEIRQMIDVLSRRRKNNPICVGEPGVGKTAVVEGLALRIIQDDVPDVLKNVTLLELDMGLLEAGAGMKGEFENRLKGVITEVKAYETPVILFIDEAHTLIGAGGSAGGSDAANLLKPALARGELRTVAATTWGEYKKYFEKDPALARRFQPIKLDEPSVEDTELILRGLKPGYENTHKVIITEAAVKAAAEFSDRYIAGRFLPDKAIDLLDTGCARVKINLSTKPPALEDKERAIQAFERTKAAMERDRDNNMPIDEETYEKIMADINQYARDADAIKARWDKEMQAAQAVLELRAELQATDKTDADAIEKIKSKLSEADTELAGVQSDNALMQLEVNENVIAQVVSDWTGIPLGKMLKDEAENIVNLDNRLGERVKGQDHALKAIAEVIQASKAGIKDPGQPMGVFLLAGPSGVGKTETGLAIADLLFGSEKNSVIINMSEFQEGHTVSRLIGSPPGYVGFGEGGMLTEAVRQKPYSVVLLDEVEKAHPDILNLFYQVFDKGVLTDGEGKEINFKNTVIILTSNLATDTIQAMTIDQEQVEIEAVAAAIRPMLSKYFKPALLARMTVLPYVSLKPDVLSMIVGLKLKKVKKTLKENNKIDLQYKDKVQEQITARCSEVETGARNIDYILKANIFPKISRELLTRMSTDGMPSRIILDVDDTDSFTIDFED
nr:type VI secretion system ATPase TssH [uncultured Desulfobacter sp.]